MARISLKQLATEVATLLGESLATDNLLPENPFPGIENRVRILAPGILAGIQRRNAESSGYLEIAAEDYAELLQALTASFTPPG